MKESKPIQETEELRTKLDYEGQLIWRFGQFFNACENGDGLKAERSLANIFNFLTEDLREKVKQRSEYENPREIRKDNYKPVKEKIETENGKTQEGEYPIAQTKELSDDYRQERHAHKEGIDHAQARKHNDRYKIWSDKVMPKYQKFGRHILDVLNEEGRLFETRRIGKGTEE